MHIFVSLLKVFMLIVAVISLSFNLSNSQNITEVLITQTKKFNPFFSKRSASINFDFTRSFVKDKLDTSYHFIVKVNEKNIEEKGYSIGSSVFSSGSFAGIAGSSSLAFDIQKSSGIEVFEKKEFFELYDCLTNVYQYISQLASYSKSSTNTMATCSCKSLTFGGEFIPQSSHIENAKFYFQIDEESSFSMSKAEFEDLAKLFVKVKSNWP